MRQTKLYQETISDTLWKVLNQLMRIDLLFSFRLVGGTALSLQLGHRISVDIDLFTDSYYGSIDFKEIDKRLQKEFSYIEMQYLGNNSMGKSYYIGKSKDNLVKLDLFYTDSFIRPEIKIGHLRLGTIEEIAAMKLGVIENGGCKKDFWDIHELLNILTFKQMVDLYLERYPYSCSKEETKRKLIDFDYADSDFDPICLKGKYWELIKEDIKEEWQKIVDFNN